MMLLLRAVCSMPTLLFLGRRYRPCYQARSDSSSDSP